MSKNIIAVLSIKRILYIAGSVLISLSGYAMSSKGYEVPKDTDTVQSIGVAVRSELPSRFKLFNWNIEKAKQGEVWANDFSKLQQNHDLIVIQEATSEDIFMNTMKEKKDTLWNYFISWVRTEDNSSSGLVTGSEVMPSTISFARTIDTEPILKTPKLASFHTYKVKGLKNSELLVINIHAINFVSLEKFARQLRQVMDRIDQHDGPVIFVGDMNTWNKKRLELLMKETKERHLVWHDFERPNVNGMHTKLDHIFVRGLKVNEIKSHTQIRSSDHFPISADFEIL